MRSVILILAIGALGVAAAPPEKNTAAKPDADSRDIVIKRGIESGKENDHGRDTRVSGFYTGGESVLSKIRHIRMGINPIEPFGGAMVHGIRVRGSGQGQRRQKDRKCRGTATVHSEHDSVLGEKEKISIAIFISGQKDKFGARRHGINLFSAVFRR